MRKLFILLIGLLIGVGAAVAAVVIKEYVFPSTGTIATADLSFRWLNGTAFTEFKWGITENATTYIMEPINITNVGNIPVTLTLSTRNLSPSIMSVTLTWNYTDTDLNPQSSVIVEVEQTVTATGSYSYDTVITATET